eukprot:10692148-Heterocapsa_arctica.AAC.1
MGGRGLPYGPRVGANQDGRVAGLKCTIAVADVLVLIGFVVFVNSSERGRDSQFAPGVLVLM